MLRRDPTSAFTRYVIALRNGMLYLIPGIIGKQKPLA